MQTGPLFQSADRLRRGKNLRALKTGSGGGPIAWLAVCSLGFACCCDAAQDDKAPPPADTKATVKVDGLSIPYRVVTISSPVQDILSEVQVEEGDRVEKGQPLAKLLSEKEEIEFRRFEKLLEKRKFDNEASQSLVKKKLLSKEKALAADAELELAQVDYELAQAKLEEKTILSTVDGIVIRRHLDPGESVDRIQPLFEIVNIDQLFLQFFLKPSQLDYFALADRIPFFMADKPDRKGEATVNFISPSADPESGLFRVKLLAENPEHRFLAGVRTVAEFPAE